MEWVSSRAGNFVRRQFTVQASLWGKPGLTRDMMVLMVPPRANRDVSPESAAQDFSASKRSSD
jgi:hypothetical protein